MRNTRLLALVCGSLALVVPSILSAAGSVELSIPVQVPAGSPPNGIPVTVTVGVTRSGEVSINGVYLVFRTLATGAQPWWTTNAMEEVSADTYTGTIPALAAPSNVEYRVYCLYNDTEVTPSDVMSFAVGDLPTIGSGRYMPFDTTWTKVVGSNYYFNVDSGAWTGSGLYRSTLVSREPDGGTQPVYQLMSIQGAFIQSPPLTGGVGTIYFTSQMSLAYNTGEVLVQVSTNDVPGVNDWETLKILVYPRVNYIRYQNAEPVVVNRPDVRFVRFFRSEASLYDDSPTKLFGTIAFDNIVFSYPPADVNLEDRLRNPGYPARDQEVRLRCAVSDASANTPAINRRVTVFYQWLQQENIKPQQDAFLSTNMYPVGDGVYEVEIPRHEPGYVYYYYKCEFDGYFYQRDPDGDPRPDPDPEKDRKAVQETKGEDLSPKYWANGETLYAPPTYFTTRYQVRHFRSEYSRVLVEATPVHASVEMDLVGDEKWQGLTLMTGITNLTWYFTGQERYTNDAPAFATAPVVWGENDQSFANPPIGGKVEVNATNGIVAEMEYEGFFLMHLNTADREYIGKRAVYQNFDEWLASETDFEEESLGIYAVKTYSEDFDAWPDDGYTWDLTKGENFMSDTPSSSYREEFQTAFGWLAEKARVIEERKTSKEATANRALLLNGLATGKVGNSGGSTTRGIEKLTFTARASINDLYYAVYTSGLETFPHGQQITTILKAEQLSPGKPYISLLANFKVNFMSASFYEIRLIQGDETEPGKTDNRLYAEVWRWNAGVATPTQIDSTKVISAGSRLDIDQTVVVTIAEPAIITVKVGSTTLSNFVDGDSANRLTSGGTVGFLTHDAVPLIKSVLVKTYPTPTTLLDQSNFDSLSGWHLGGARADGGGTRWSKVLHTDASGSAMRLTRAIPNQTIAIWAAMRRPGAMVPDPPPVAGATNEYALALKHGGIPITSLSYIDRTEYMKSWSEGFVEIRYESGDVDVVIDEPRLYPWRANTRTADNSGTAEADGVENFAWTSENQQDQWLNANRGWAVIEGVVTDSSYNPNSNDVHLEKSRANPALRQALVSPVLTNGIGSINFGYTVSGGTAVYAIDRTDPISQQSWATVAIFTNTPGQTGTRTVYIRENHMGRIRIRLTGESHADAKLMIDEANARNYPPRDETSWIAYNALVTDQQTNRLFIGKSCYLNNSATEGVRGTGVSLLEHQPFVQTPSVGTGIGEIAFWLRSWTGTKTTVLTLKVAPTAETPDAEWTFVTNLTVAAGTSFIYTNYPTIYDLDNHVLRIYGDTNGTDRVCIDNILVTEPVRASFEIQTVRLIPEQPLASGPVAVEVDIGRFLMNPQNVKVFLSYNLYSNTWGVANWWTHTNSPGRSHLIELQPVAPGSRTFRTPENTFIPAAPVDAVVQFRAWGTHYEEGGSPANPSRVFQTEPTFVNPEWYFPVDINFNRQAEGWSPYYISYSCPPYSVWVNEVNANTPAAGEFIELIGPAQASLHGWRIERIYYNTLAVIDEVCTIADFTIANKTNGWGFFVWGDAGVANVNHVFLTAKQGNVPLNAGLHLFRSCGALEQKLCWGLSAKNVLEPLGYLYAGNKGLFSEASFQLRNRDDVAAGETRDDFYWPPSAVGMYTPGNVNDGQFMAEIVPPPSAQVLLISVVGLHGIHYSTYEPLISTLVNVGSSAQIPYTADPWYRIATFESNGTEVPDAAGLSNYLWQAEAIAESISNHVTFAAVESYGTNVPVDWLQQWTEPAVAAGDGDPFDVGTEYLLNTDPTVETFAALRVTDISFAGGELHVTVQLERDNLSKLGDINGTLWLQSRESLLSGSFEDVSATAITGAQFNDGEGGDAHTYTFPGVTDDRFFYRAIIK